MHGRLKENIKERICAADWDVIRRIKAHPDVRIPIFANGGIGCFEDVASCIAATGADGVMSSEALLENPGLYSDGWPTLPGTHVRLADALRTTAAGSAVGGLAAGGSSGRIGSEGGDGSAAGSDSWLQPHHARRSDSIDFAWAYLQLAGFYEEDLGAVRGHLVKILFAPLKIDTALRNAFLAASGGVPAWQALLIQLARMFKHPLAEAAAAADADAPLDAIYTSYALEVARRASNQPVAAMPTDGATAAARLRLPYAAAGAAAGAGDSLPDAAGSCSGPLLANQLSVDEWAGCALLRPRPAERAAAFAALMAKRHAKGAAKKAKRTGSQGSAALAAAAAGAASDDASLGAISLDVGAAHVDSAAADAPAPSAVRPPTCYDEDTVDVAEGGVTAGEAAPPAKRARMTVSHVDADSGIKLEATFSGSASGGSTVSGSALVGAAAVATPHDEAAVAAPSKKEAKAAAVAAAAEAAAAVIKATEWSSFVGRAAPEADWDEWRSRRAAEPSAGYSKPDFLVDPLQPGLWYMRHQAILPRVAPTAQAAGQSLVHSAADAGSSGAVAVGGAGAAPVPPAALTAGAVAATLRYGGRCGRKDGPEAFLAGFGTGMPHDVDSPSGI